MKGKRNTPKTAKGTRPSRVVTITRTFAQFASLGAVTVMVSGYYVFWLRDKGDQMSMRTLSRVTEMKATEEAEWTFHPTVREAILDELRSELVAQCRSKYARRRV